MNLTNRLPHLTAVLAAFLLSLGATAQDFPIPYNPDEDANGLIGTPDLLSLLALFGEEFSAAVVAENNESAIMYVGNLPYPVCVQSCKNLPGMWDLASIEDLGLVWADVFDSNENLHTWIRPMGNSHEEGSYSYALEFFNGLHMRVSATPSSPGGCYCSIKEIPKVEYTWCYSAPTDLLTCASELVEQGWIPLGGIDIVPSSNVTSQAFWRWAE